MIAARQALVEKCTAQQVNVEDLHGFENILVPLEAWSACADHALFDVRDTAELGDLAARGFVEAGIVDIPFFGSSVVGVTVTLIQRCVEV